MASLHSYARLGHYTIPDPTNKSNNVNIDPNNDLPDFGGAWKWISFGVGAYEIYDNYKSSLPDPVVVPSTDGTKVVIYPKK